MKPNTGESRAEFLARAFQANIKPEVADLSWQLHKSNTIKNSIYKQEIAKQNFESLYEQDHYDFSSDVKIIKSLDEPQLCFGWANVTIKADGSLPIDWQGDVSLTKELEQAAYNYVLKYRIANNEHEQNTEIRGELVESMMFTKEKMAALNIPEGILPEGWWVGFHISDTESYKKVKSGEYSMFSIEGTAARIPIATLGGE